MDQANKDGDQENKDGGLKQLRINITARVRDRQETVMNLQTSKDCFNCCLARFEASATRKRNGGLLLGVLSGAASSLSPCGSSCNRRVSLADTFHKTLLLSS